MEDDLFGGLFSDPPAPPASPAPPATPKEKPPKPKKKAAKSAAEPASAPDEPSAEPARASGEKSRAERTPSNETPATTGETAAPTRAEPAPVAPPLAEPPSAAPPTNGAPELLTPTAPQKQPRPTLPPHTPHAWPSALQGTPSVTVLENALAKNRLAHGLLLHGDDFALLTEVALALADRLLNTPAASAYFPPAQHPDCFALRPSGASRQITADDTRDLIAQTQVSGSVSPHKVAILYECDRMNLAAANIFLKTLEEPPANTTLLLLTTQPYALLPTVRSRVLHFRFPVGGDSLLGQAAGLSAWLSDYRAWLGQLCDGLPNKRAVADAIMTLYGLLARFEAILAAATAEAWETEKTKLPDELDKDEQKAVEKRLANGIRQKIFAEIEHATRAFALPRLTGESAETARAAIGDPADESARTRRAHTDAITALEHSVGLLRLNINHATALENFLLHSMRLWARR